MDILVVTDQYPPEIRGISVMIQELAENLALRGHSVTVVTSYPRPRLISDKTKNALSDFVVEKGVRIFRAKSFHYKMTPYWIRGIGELLLPYIFLTNIRRFLHEGVDVVVVYTPPLSLTIFGRIIKRIFRAKFVLNVYDIFPQNAIDLKILQNPILVKFFERVERQSYRAADRVRVYSNSNATCLIQRGVPPSKVTTIYNWIDLSPYHRAKATGRYRREYGLEGKFVFLFAGIVGPAQGLDFVILVAEQIRSIPGIQFVLVGDGREKGRLVRIVKERGLDNIKFYPFVSMEDYPFLVKDIDVGLACLSCKNTTPVFPGKLLGFMASAVPIVAFLNQESDGHQLIREARCGYSLVSDDYKKAADLVRKLFQERERLPLLGRNGLEYARTHFSKEACIDKMEKLILSAG